MIIRHLTTKTTLEESRIKIVIVGDKNVGKTNFLISYCSTPSTTHDRTKSIFNNFNAHLKYKDKIVKLDLWELPSSEEYTKMRQINYPQTDAFFILYSNDDVNSLNDAVHYWYPEIKMNNFDNNPVVFIGNKTDIRENNKNDSTHTFETNNTTDDQLDEINALNKNNCVSEKEAKEKIIGKLGKGVMCFECSALMQTGINEVCLETVKSVFNQRERNYNAKRDNCCFLI